MPEPKCVFCDQPSIGMIYNKHVCRLCIDRAGREYVPSNSPTSCRGG